jgi:membrane protein YdbS with pleckstrin-like domain
VLGAVGGDHPGRFPTVARIQGVEMSQGPYDRSRDLASVFIRLPDGPISPAIHHLDLADARALMAGELTRLYQAMPTSGSA